MDEYKITDAVHPLKSEVKLGDKVHLKNQVQEVVECEKTGVKMLNIDADELAPGDLSYIKKLGLTISNPETEAPIALGVELDTFGKRLSDWLEDEEDDDDSSFYSPSGRSWGSSSSGWGGGFGGGGFGGFGGGSFSGGGASRGF